MKPFDHQGKRYIIINGKEYFLIRGYRDHDGYRGNLIFIQVAGRTPLHKEDLPDQDWTLIKTKGPEHNVYTAYLDKYFDYEPPAQDKTKRLYFIGMTPRGTTFLMLNFLRDAYNLSPTPAQFRKALDDWKPIRRGDVEYRQDHGNSEVSALSVEVGPYRMDYDRAVDLFGLRA